MNVNCFCTSIVNETGHKCQNQSQIRGDALISISLTMAQPVTFSEFLSLEHNENMYNTHVYGIMLT